jgi:hypothetical protein
MTRSKASSAILAPWIVSTALAMLAGTASAAVDTMAWKTVGNLQAKAQFLGKAVTLKQGDAGTWTAEFATGGAFMLSGGPLELNGSWTQTKTKFSVRLDPASVAALLDGMERDLAAQSGLRVELTPKSSKFDGQEVARSGTLKGLLTVKATVRYPDFSTKAGSLVLTYRFVANPTMMP